MMVRRTVKPSQICVAGHDLSGARRGAHEGKNAGRACWAIVGSLIGGKIQGTYAQKFNNCWRCDFMIAVKKEEEPAMLGLSATRLGLDRALQKQYAMAGNLPYSASRVAMQHQAVCVSSWR
jgi:hypothetical protein